MAKWLKDYLNFGTRRDPPQPPRPDYSESEILRAYRVQKELDFEDPYQHTDKEQQNGGFSSCSATVSLPSFPAFGSVLPNGVEVWNAIFYACVHEKLIFLIVCSVVVCPSSPIDIEVILEIKLICFVHMCCIAGESGVAQAPTY